MKQSINKKLTAWLRKGHSITALEALKRWGCMRLAARVEELRRQGMPVRTKMVSRNGKTFAQYQL